MRVAILLVPLLLVSQAVAQAPRGKDKSPPDIPTISTRYFVGGSAKLTVTGAFQSDGDVPLNAKASFGDGEKTWLQFGVSGAKEPNVLITYGDGELGIIFGQGTSTATAESAHCSGQAEVTASSITGHYVCKGVTGYDRSTGKMSDVAVTVTFTAKS